MKSSLGAILVRLSAALYEGDMMTNLYDSSTSAEFCYLCETHYDPGGCNLAAQTIASYIEDMLAMTASKKERK